jgi:zinc transport system substrate-binding protein
MKNLLPITFLLLVLSSCNIKSETSDKPMISVSILPQQYFIEQLAGDLVEINVMIPPGASPATYEPSVSQLGKLDQSEVYMRIGHVGFEQSWMEKIKSVNPDMKIVDLSDGIELILEEAMEDEKHHHHKHSGTDPHVWMSTVNAKIIAENINSELLLLFPGKKDYLSGRLDQFNHFLDSLHVEIGVTLEHMETRKFMIYHPALSYYAREYGLTQYSLELEGKTPSPAHLKEMTDLARQNHISKILIQNQFDRRNAEVLAEETGSMVIPFDPLSLNWDDQMSYIAKQLNPSEQ